MCVRLYVIWQEHHEILIYLFDRIIIFPLRLEWLLKSFWDSFKVLVIYSTSLSVSVPFSWWRRLKDTQTHTKLTFKMLILCLFLSLIRVLESGDNENECVKFSSLFFHSQVYENPEIITFRSRRGSLLFHVFWLIQQILKFQTSNFFYQAYGGRVGHGRCKEGRLCKY